MRDLTVLLTATGEDKPKDGAGGRGLVSASKPAHRANTNAANDCVGCDHMKPWH